jgi:7,8-dihydropterin-6-yl-methyl-4-(beta-D-ribofuranosyl)aminobenzene 5'-phosphate synthase
MDTPFARHAGARPSCNQGKMKNLSAIRVYCVVDNCVLRGSHLWGEHGAAFLIETSDGRVLFDTGQSGSVLLHNASCMGIALNQIDALAFSHAHYDHTGGLASFLEHCRSNLPLYASPDIFRARYARRGDELLSIGLQLDRKALVQQLDLRLSATPIEILPGVWTTGEIDERLEFEGRSAQHGILIDDEWQPDPYHDDLSLVIEHSEGLIVICGCCHAGILNTLTHIRQGFGQNILAILGGTHLAGATPGSLASVVERLRTPNHGDPPQLFLNHCTGERAFLALAQTFGDQVQPYPAGMVLTF